MAVDGSSNLIGVIDIHDTKPLRGILFEKKKTEMNSTDLKFSLRKNIER